MIPNSDYWLYCLKDKTLGYIYLDSNNSIAYSVDPVGLVYTPDGWQKKSIAWERDMDKLGLVRSFTVSLNFVMDGKALIDQIAINQTFEKPIQLLIKQLTASVGTDVSFDYVDFYVGELNLSALESDEITVSVPIAEGGITKQYKANTATQYEFEPTDNLYNDGIYLYDTADFIVTPITVPNNTPTHIVPASLIQREGTAPGFAAFDNLGDPYSGDPNSDADKDKDLFETSQDIPYLRIFGNISIQLNLGASPSPTARYVVCLCSNLRPGVLFNSPGVAYLTPNGNAGYNLTGTSNTVDFSFDQTFTASAGEKFFIYAYSNTGGAAITLQQYLDSSFKVSFKSRYKATYTKTITAWNLFKKLVGRITGDESKAVSTLLQANENIVITCGDAVRGLDGAKIKTSLDDFFRFCKVVFCAGIGIENGKIVIESIDHFLDVSSPIDLGECRGFKWKFADDLFFNSLKIGWDDKTSANTDNVNGKLQFNTFQTYTTPITSISKQLELVTNYVADPYYIEIVRVNLEGKTTTDNNADSDVIVLNTEASPVYSYTANFATFFANYLIHLIGGAADLPKYPAGISFDLTDSTGANTGTYTSLGSYVPNGTDLFIIIGTPVTIETNKAITIGSNALKLKRVAYVNTDTGVPDVATLYNIEYLTPKRIVGRWRKYFNSVLFQFPGMGINFESTPKNRDLKTDTGTEVVDEDTDEIVGIDRWFKAINYTFECNVADVVPQTLNTNPNKGFKTTNPVNSKDFTGILLKGAMAANELTAQSFKLLAGPSEDVSNLLKTSKIIY